MKRRRRRSFRGFLSGGHGAGAAIAAVLFGLYWYFFKRKPALPAKSASSDDPSNTYT
jgi:hypothetical protein